MTHCSSCLELQATALKTLEDHFAATKEAELHDTFCNRGRAAASYHDVTTARVAVALHDIQCRECQQAIRESERCSP